MRRIFWGFCRNWFLMSPLHYLSGHSILASNSWRYLYSKNDSPLSPIRGVANSPYRWYGESSTPRIVESGSRRLPPSLIRGVGDSPHHRYGESAIEFLKRKLSVSMIRRDVDSPHQWYGESPTPRIVELESRRLCVSPIWRVDDSAYCWVGGVDDYAYRWYGEKNEFSFDFQYFKRLKHSFKGSIWPIISQGCNVLSQ
jgi:hypothetical protein